ncbi:GTPase IMAP family member 8-like protein [Labeo rohita]|uniref:GTPase IMAP family member 8-like protein n=1 Tax=Labeo rohita TaxID=84645 RepID=A0A498LBA4_LABRO|nr:GTPase IMAP family member 8-like protein [Labeo rohita]RXN37598.1 GTPase IMAP family member 8-like protein [Labeo rohita]
MASAAAGRHSPEIERPDMSDLRIVLLGKNESENRRVGNTILGATAFHSEAASYSQQHSMRIRAEVEKRKITVIKSHLLHPHFPQHQIIEAVRECVSLSAPGPHVFVLILQYKDFSENDRQRLKYVLNLFSEQAMKHTIVLTTDEETHGYKFAIKNTAINDLIKECGDGHLEFETINPGWCSELFRRIEDEEFLVCNKYKDEGGLSVNEDLSRSGSMRRDVKEKKYSDLKESTETGCDGGVMTTGKAKLNIVLCGNNPTLKNTVSKIFRGTMYKKTNKLLQLKEMSKVCVKREEMIHGRQISVIEFPALTQLSEKEVMRQTHRCVSLCHPGVHVFILIIPDAPLTDEDKEEMEEIQRIFSSRINKHIMILIKQNSEHQTEKLNEETQSVIERFGGRHNFIDLNTQVSVLMEKLEQMVEENSGDCFSTETLMEAQMEKLLKFEERKKKIHSIEMWFHSQGNDQRICMN